MTEPQKVAWQSLFLKAALEPLDSSELDQRVKEAEIAISASFQELRATSHKSEDRQALEDALHDLNFLMSEKFTYSVRQSSQQLGRE
jgi:hypothetical protein